MAKEKAISDSSCAWRGQGCKEKPAGPVWWCFCGRNRHGTDSAPGTDTGDCTHKQDGAEVGPKGQLGTLAGSCTFKRTETGGGSSEALKEREDIHDGDSHLAGRASLSPGDSHSGVLGSAPSYSLPFPALSGKSKLGELFYWLLNLFPEPPKKKMAREIRQVECINSFIYLTNIY